MAAMHIVVLGDSVAWGQGLTEEQKFYSLVGTKLANGSPPQLTVLAHSGAIIGVGVEKNIAPASGEVPASYPTILQQCQAVTTDPQQVDLVLLNGGINDVDVHFILNPLTDPGDLRDLIVQYCYRDTSLLLLEVARKFSNPKTRIVFTCYFPILSQQSEFKLLPAYLLLHGITVPPFLVPVSDLAFGRPVANCRQFWTESTAQFEKAIAEVNAGLGGEPRLFLARAPFEDENAALAPKAWLWGINWDLSVQDPVQNSRHAACDIYEPDIIQRQLCYRASVGHPNIMGAEQFANAICAVLQGAETTR